MITLYRRPGCPGCGAVGEALVEMVVSHEVVEVESVADLPPELRGAGELPVLVDGAEVVSGTAAVLEHLHELEGFRALWYKFQSDACYCDERGEPE
jgi:glutathione S-transferase